MIRITTYTDESGNPVKRNFIVTTVIVLNNRREEFESSLQEIEEASGKYKKWADVRVERRSRYTKLLVKKEIFKLCKVYFTIFNSKDQYASIASTQIVQSIQDYAGKEEYLSTIFLDLVNNQTTQEISRNIHRSKIRFKKIRALDDNNSVGLKFADAICGLIRDIENEGIGKSYKAIYKKLVKL